MADALAKGIILIVQGMYSHHERARERIGAHAAMKRWKNRQKVDIEYAGGIQPRRRLYGYFRASGLNVMPPVVTGPTGTRLHKCLAISDGEIDSFTAVTYNNTRMEVSTFSGGPLTVAPYATFGQIHLHTGTNPQDADGAAQAAPGWTPDHKGTGIAYAYMFFDQSAAAYPSGVPLITIEGLGCKIYEPRDDSTPGDDPLSDTFKIFSTNPVLQLVDFLLWESGGEQLPDSIDWDDVVTAANICDESVTVPGPLGVGTTTQARYTSSIEVYAPLQSGERDKTITDLAKAFMGVCFFSNGKWHIRAGAYTAPVGSIYERDFLEDFRLQTAQARGRGGIMNTIRGTYVDQVEQTQPKAFPEVSSSTYVTEDEEVIFGEVEYLTARSAYEAQRNAIQHLRLSRRRFIVSGTFRYRTRNFILFDIVLVTCSKMGWVDQPCRIIRHLERQDFTVEMDLMEVGSTDYSDPDPADYLYPEDIAVPTSTTYAPPAPRDLRATGGASSVLLEWDPPENPPIGVLYQVYMNTSSTPFGSAVAVGPQTAQNSIVIPLTSSSTVYFWVIAIDPATAAVSTQSPPVNGVPSSPASVSAALGAVVTPGSALADVLTTTATTNSVTVTPTGGTAPYTYAWTFTAGGTNIAIDASTSAATTFSAITSLAQNETRTGTARCRVTDNVAATYDVFVAVTITRGYTITLTNATLNATGGGMSAAVASITIAPTGEVQETSTGSASKTYRWVASGADRTLYDARITLNSGTLNSGNPGTWYQMGGSTAAYAVGVKPPPAGSSSQTLTLEIRLHASPFTVLATAAVTLNETVT